MTEVEYAGIYMYSDVDFTSVLIRYVRERMKSETCLDCARVCQLHFFKASVIKKL